MKRYEVLLPQLRFYESQLQLEYKWTRHNSFFIFQGNQGTDDFAIVEVMFPNAFFK